MTELSRTRHDKGAYLSRARQAIFNLEELLKLDLEETGEDNDLGWDPTTLRKEVKQRIENQTDDSSK